VCTPETAKFEICDEKNEQGAGLGFLKNCRLHLADEAFVVITYRIDEHKSIFVKTACNCSQVVSAQKKHEQVDKTTQRNLVAFGFGGQKRGV